MKNVMILVVFAFLSVNGLYAQKVEKKKVIIPEKQTTLALRASTAFFLPPDGSVKKDSVRKINFCIQTDSVRYQKFQPGDHQFVAPARILKFQEGRSVLLPEKKFLNKK